MAYISIPQDIHHKSITTKRPSNSFLSKTLKFLLGFLFIIFTTILILQIQTIKSSFSCPFISSSQSSNTTELMQARLRLRDSITFLPLKDLRLSNERLTGNSWFMSSMNDTYEDHDSQYLYFPSESSNGRLLCLNARNVHDGAKNTYGFAWPDALPLNATIYDGLTFISDTEYDHINIWHGLSAILPFVSWHERKQCVVPARWVLFHWGELRTMFSSWVKTMAEVSIGEVRIEDFARNGDGPACFEKALVFRHNEGAMSRERKEEVFDMIKCKARVYCNLSEEVRKGNEENVIRMTLFLRTGARSFKNDSAFIEVFKRECEKVEGCRMKVAWITNLTICEQVKLLGETDILVTSHGAQLTNMIFMDKRSSIMEFYPMGWKDYAGNGQFLYRWLADWSGMQHKGSWWEPEDNMVECPHKDKMECFLNLYKDSQIGHDEAYFSDWASKVLSEVKQYRLSEAARSSNQQNESWKTCPCS